MYEREVEAARLFSDIAINRVREGVLHRQRRRELSKVSQLSGVSRRTIYNVIENNYGGNGLSADKLLKLKYTLLTMDMEGT